MNRKVSLIILCSILLTFPYRLAAQYYFYSDDFYDTPLLFELGGSIGAMNALTDLGGNKGIGKKFIKDLNINQTHVCGSVYFAATYNNMLAVRLEGTFGQVSGADSVLKSVRETTKGRYERNLSFRSRISEISLTGEIHPMYLFMDYGGDRYPPRLSPYLIAGIGYFSFNPEAKLGNNWVALQPLSTEGQGFPNYPDRQPYKLKQLNIPLGLGGRFELSPMFNLRAELIYRVLKTDYLDDVSTTYIEESEFTANLQGNLVAQAIKLNARWKEVDPSYRYNSPGSIRGDPKDNDGYFTFSLKLGLILGRQRIR